MLANIVEYYGDINSDGVLNASDLFLMLEHLNGNKAITDCIKADINSDTTIDIVDFILLKSCVLGETQWSEMYDESEDFMEVPVKAIGASLPSQGNAEAIIFYLDFPDCKYERKMSVNEIEQIAFGEADINSKYFPFESMSAFYERSSKGCMNLEGKVFEYTAQNSILYYQNDKDKLVQECLNAFNNSIDFKEFDGNSDGTIDVCLITVPETADETYWWPSAGPTGDEYYKVDGVNVGYVITGNAEPTNVKNFNSGYLHEMGHCMGIPDYYLYTEYDYEGMHGDAGTELMDADAYSDFCAVSKFMLGWYKKSQTEIYDKSYGTKTYTLYDAQTDKGNCVLIPYKSGSGYYSEYFVIEYQSFTGNNSAVEDLWWQKFDPGIRVYHMSSETQFNGYWTYFKYESGSTDDEGRRFIRLVNEGEGKGAFKSGDIITNATPGFGWYDNFGKETVNPEIQINIGNFENGKYTITISNLN